MTVLLCVASLYFMHLGFRRASAFALSLGGVAAGLCLASSIVGKQYIFALTLYAMLYAGSRWRSLKQGIQWSSVWIVTYSFLAAAMPILCYIVFNREHYTYYESTFIRRFCGALQGNPPPNDIRFYATQLWNLFFGIPGPRLFLTDFLPIPLPYYALLLPGLGLAVWQGRYEIVLLATIPVVAVFISAGGTTEHRMLLAIPFWIILMSFTIAGLLKLRPWPGIQIVLGVTVALILVDGLLPSVQYIYAKTKGPFTIRYYNQEQVAVSRFLREVVAGKRPPNQLSVMSSIGLKMLQTPLTKL
jgi:hypothetical protein